MIASPLSFQPWFLVPFGDRVWYSRYPSPSLSPSVRAIRESVEPLPVPSNHARIACPRVQVRKRDHKHQGTRVIGVVGAVRIDVQERQRTAPDLIRDAPGFLVAPVVGPPALQTRQAGEAGVE